MPSSVEHNPLISLYRALEKSEIRRLGKWLDSPAHNQRDDVRQLHAYLVTRDHLRKTSALTKKRIWGRIFPDTPFDDARLRQTFHWALRATEAFLAYQRWSEDPFNEQLALIRALQQRNLSTPLRRHLEKGRKLLAAVPLQDEKRLRQQYQLELEQDEYRTYHEFRQHPRFQEIADTLDLTYLIEKLKASWNMLFHQRVYKTEFRIDFLEEVLAYVQTLDLEKYPVLAIHYYGYLGITDDDASGTTLGRLRNLVEQHGRLLSEKDLRYVILMAINLCITKMNQGKEPYVREAFAWYSLGFERDTIAENGLLTRATYLNVVSIALKLQEFTWVDDFLLRFSHQLEEELRENTERFARAQLSYARRAYDIAMPLLVQVDFKHPVYNLLAKTLLLKIYFELDEFDALESQVDATLTYIRRKKLSDLHRNNFNNIARLTRQLARLGPSRKKREELRQKVTTTTPLSERKWLLEQLATAGSA